MYWEEHKKPLSYKFQILKFIAEQGIVSIEDINRYFNPDRDNARAIRVTLYDMGVGHLRYYSPDVKNIEKDTDFDIIQWYSESWLRALPACLRQYLCSSKIPDAIFYVKEKDGSQKKFYIEYERNLKSPNRYVEIFRSYGKCEDVHDQNVIYFCAPGIAKKLKAIEQRQASIGHLDAYGFNFKFIDLESFYQNYREKRAEKQIKQEQAVVGPDAKVEAGQKV